MVSHTDDNLQKLIFLSAYQAPASLTVSISQRKDGGTCLDERGIYRARVTAL